jgi:hypothetical protein
VFAATADDEWRFLRAAVLGTQEQRLAHVVTAFLEGDGDAALAARVVGAPPLAGLAQGVVDAFALANHDVPGKTENRLESIKTGYESFHLFQFFNLSILHFFNFILRRLSIYFVI